MASGQDKEELQKVVEELGEDKKLLEVVIDPKVTFAPCSTMLREGDKPPLTPPPGLAKCQQI